MSNEKLVLVTGATRGIGSAILRTLGKQGLPIIGTATSQEGAAKISTNLEELGLKGEGIVLNLRDRSVIDEVIRSISKRYGAILILVNNAAITSDNLFLKMKTEEWNDVLDINLNGTFYLIKACIRNMLKARWGRIINIGSLVGTAGNVGQANYAAAKAALVGLTKSIAQEVASRNITANVVAPGFIDTDMTRCLSKERQDHLLRKIPMERLGQPEDIASAVSFLASDSASYITGQTLHVNGGMYMV
jgi:3-oxoacyl-[acyl-carrier protein] reductase